MNEGNRLRHGWINLLLSDVAEWGSGGTPSRKNPEYYGGTIPWIKTGELGQPVITTTEETLTTEGLENSSAKIFPKGSVAIAMYGATIGKTSILGIDASTNQACAVAIPNELTTSRFLYYFLLSQKDLFVAAGKGGAQPNISQGVIKNWPIPLPPLEEQKRIADKLERLLARVDKGLESLARVPEILKHFRQAVLAAAVSGELSKEWRNSMLGAEEYATFFSISIPKSWKVVEFSSLIQTIRGGSTAVPTDKESEFPILRSSSVRSRFVDLSDVRYLQADESHNALNFLSEGDLLFTRLSGSVDYVANCAVVRNLGKKRVQYPDRLYCVKVDQNTNVSYMELVFASPVIRAQVIKNAKSSAGHQRISIQDISSQPIPLPLPEEQAEIVRRVESLFAFADALEARYQAALEQYERLTPATLAKAFRGELVPQDPSDEPASVLLERVKESRINQIDKPRSTLRRTSKSSANDLLNIDAEVGSLQKPRDRVILVSTLQRMKKESSRQFDPTVRVLEGHSRPIYSVASLPDGRIVSASGDTTLRVWDLETGQSRILKGHTDVVRAVAVLSNDRIVSGSADNTLRIWDLNTGQSRVLKGHAGWVRAVAVLKDGRVVSGSADNTLRVWDLETGQSEVLKGHNDWIRAVAVLPDGRVVSGSADETVRLWDLKSGYSQVLRGHTDWIRAVAVLPDGRVVSGSADETIRLWDLKSGHSEVLEGHTESVTALTALTDGRLVSGSADNTLRVWDMKTGRSGVLSGHTDWIFALISLPDGRVVSASGDNTIRVWELVGVTGSVKTLWRTTNLAIDDFYAQLASEISEGLVRVVGDFPARVEIV